MRVVLAISALGGCALMIFFGEYAWALACEDNECTASSGAGVMRAAAWVALASVIAAVVLDRLHVWWAVAAAAAVAVVAFVLWLLLFLVWVGSV